MSTPTDQPIRFQHVWDPMLGAVSPNGMYYFDEMGVRWYFTLGTGHRFEAIYDDFIANGGKVEAADVPAQPA